MSHTIPLSEAGGKLAELVARLGPGDEVVLTRDDQPVAKLVPAEPARSRGGFGAGKGKLVV